MMKKMIIILSLCLATVFITACTINVNVNTDQTTTGTEANDEADTVEKETAKSAEETAAVKTTEAAPEQTTKAEEKTAKAPEKATDQETTKAAEEKTTAAEKKTEEVNYKVTFEREYGNNQEYAMITAYKENGDVAWDLTTPSYDIAQLSRTNNIGVNGQKYYYIEAGTVKALNLADGSLLWENSDFGGSIAEDAFAFGDRGELYLCGYLGPDLFIADPNGKTIKKIDTFSNDFFWPYNVEYLGDKLAITYEGSPEMQQTTKFVDLYSYTLTDESFGDYPDNPEKGNGQPEGGVNAIVTSVSESSHLSEPQYGVDHTADSVVDGDITTAWCEAASGQGIGEWVELHFDKAYTFSGVTIYAGFQESDDLYNKNSRPSAMTVIFSDGSSQKIYLNDVLTGQTIYFDTPVETDSMRFVIDDVYPGYKYEDTLITEIAAFYSLDRVWI